MRLNSSGPRIGALALLGMGVLGAACGGGDKPASAPVATAEVAGDEPAEATADPGVGGGATDPRPADSTTATGLTDGQIAAIVVTANAVDVEAGKLALQKSKSKEVQKFATWMVNGHGALNVQAGELATKLKLTPEPNPTSESLKQGGEDNLASLRKLSGAAFDKAYIEHEVAYHKAVLDAVTNTLIPNTQNAELKALLTSAGPTIAAHLEHAEKMLAAMTASK
jgi:putative membrane protein